MNTRGQIARVLNERPIGENERKNFILRTYRHYYYVVVRRRRRRRNNDVLRGDVYIVLGIIARKIAFAHIDRRARGFTMFTVVISAMNVL